MNQRRRASLRPAFTLAILLLLPGLGGCGIQVSGAGRGDLRIESRDRDRVNVGESFTTGYFSVSEDNALTVVLIEGPPQAPTAALTVRMFWLPQVGSTPISRTATNASVHYVVFGSSISNRNANAAAREVGLYSGAGFFYINSGRNARNLRAGLWEANIQLADRSEGFTDQLGPAMIAGAIRAQRDDEQVNALLQRISRLTTDRLGYPRLVMAD